MKEDISPAAPTTAPNTSLGIKAGPIFIGKRNKDKNGKTSQGSQRPPMDTQIIMAGDDIDGELVETLSKGATAGDWIHDFVHSQNPMFKGDSKKQRIKRALGAYYKHQNEMTDTHSFHPDWKNLVHARGASKFKFHKESNRTTAETKDGHVVGVWNHHHRQGHIFEEQQGNESMNEEIIHHSSGKILGSVHREGKHRLSWIATHTGLEHHLGDYKYSRHPTKQQAIDDLHSMYDTYTRNHMHEETVNEFNHWVGSAYKHGQKYTIWQKSVNGHHYEIEHFHTKKKEQHHGTLDQIKQKGYVMGEEVVASLEDLAPVFEAYNKDAVDNAIAGQGIGKKQSALIHRLLKGRHGHLTAPPVPQVPQGISQFPAAAKQSGLQENYSDWYETMEKKGKEGNEVQFRIKNAGGRTEAHLGGKKIGHFDHNKRQGHMIEARKVTQQLSDEEIFKKNGSRAHKGYMIHKHSYDGAGARIEKDGQHIGYAKDFNDAKHIIDTHLTEDIHSDEAIRREKIKGHPAAPKPHEDLKNLPYGTHAEKFEYHRQHMQKAKEIGNTEHAVHHEMMMQRHNVQEGFVAKPLKGHPYHEKTDAELHYIIKDAGEASRLHDQMHRGTNKHNKYADQVNDAATVLHYRKTLKPMKEDVLFEAGKKTKSSKEMKRKYLGKTRGTTATGKTAHQVVVDPIIKTDSDKGKVRY